MYVNINLNVLHITIRCAILQTNEPFLVNVLRHPKFLSGVFDTNFIDEHKRLFKFEKAENRAQKLLYYMADVVVNGPSTPFVTKIPPSKLVPTVPHVRGECR